MNNRGLWIRFLLRGSHLVLDVEAGVLVGRLAYSHLYVHLIRKDVGLLFRPFS